MYGREKMPSNMQKSIGLSDAIASMASCEMTGNCIPAESCFSNRNFWRHNKRVQSTRAERGRERGEKRGCIPCTPALASSSSLFSLLSPLVPLSTLLLPFAVSSWFPPCFTAQFRMNWQAKKETSQSELSKFNRKLFLTREKFDQVNSIQAHFLSTRTRIDTHTNWLT